VNFFAKDVEYRKASVKFKISIHGFAKLINRKANLPEDVIRFIGIIERESQRMERFAKNM